MSEQMLSLILERIDGLTGRFDTLEGRFDNLEERFDRLESRVGGLGDEMRSRFDKVDAKLVSLQEQVVRNSELESAINELAAASARHEIEIRVLKKAVAVN